MQLKEAFDDAQTVRIFFLPLRINPFVINPVDLYFSGSMNDVFVVQHQANMNNSSGFVIKKSQIAGQSCLQKINNFSLFCLLPGISFQLNVLLQINSLGKTGTINAKMCSSAPSIRRV